MKRIFSIIVSVMTIICALPFSGSAEEISLSTNTEKIISEVTEYLPDGSSFLITVTEEQPKVRATTKTGMKTYSLTNKDGVILWQFVVKGTFSVNPGVSSVCTANSHSINIMESSWQNESASTTRSGNQAIGDATFIKKLWIITTETKSCHVVLTCDVNGNLS